MKIRYLIPLAICCLMMHTTYAQNPTNDKQSPSPAGYQLQGSMQADATLVKKDYTAIHQYMRSKGWDYSEHPNSSDKDHNTVNHCEVVYDKQLQQYVFRFINHAGAKALDGDRGSIVDRQRNEMKTQTSPQWSHLNGQWDEWQVLQWKFKIPKGFRPSSNFCHIHQLKAQEGNNGAPLITLTPRSDADGSNPRMQVIHSGDTRESTKGVLIDHVPLSEFEDEWVQVETEMHYTHHGSFRIKIIRLRDGKELMNQRFDDVDLFRTGATNIRSKFGIYRSYGRKMKDTTDRPDNGIKDEILFLADFKVYEKTSTQPLAQSEWVYPGKDGKLVYKTTPQGDRIMDFSYAGYKGGGVPLPEVPVQVTVHPLPNGVECSAIIQAAIDKVSALPLDKDGFRGTVLLAPGEYLCDKSLMISADGVVLRGSGKTQKESTIRMTGPKHTAIVLNNGRGQRTGNRLGSPTSGSASTKITDTYVPAGAMHFTVADASGFAVGDKVEICKPVTAEWVKFMQMDDLVRDGKPQTWISTSSWLITEREIAAIQRNKITLTVPLVDSYNAAYTGNDTRMVQANGTERLKQAGVENLRIVSPPQAVNHTEALYYAVRVSGEDCWLRDLDLFETMESVGLNGCRITVQRVSVVREAMHQGSSKPAEFAPNAGQVLLDRCSVAGDNIWYVAVGAGQTGPIVFLNCNFTGNGRIEGHQRWSTGFLMDNCKVPGGGIDFKNRGSMGSGHGWGTAWAVAWNCEAMSYVNQLPPGTCNWVIGCYGESTPLPRPFNREGPNLPEGIFDSPGVHVTPQSLYLTQLKERLGEQALKAIGY